MKITSLDEPIYVVDNSNSVRQFIKTVIDSGTQEDAFYVCNLGDFARKHKLWITSLPRVKPHYAVKCNDSMPVIKVLAALGTGFDCASMQETNKVLSVGVHPSQIIYANPVKAVTHILHAKEVGVETMTFDNATELTKIKKHYPTAKLVLRIKCDSKDAQVQFGKKFGCDPELEAPELLELAYNLGLNLIGVSFHVGTCCAELTAYERAIAAARHVFDVAKKIGYKLNFLDIGGGYPGDYGPTFGKIADSINAALDKYFPDPEVRVIAEPGRYYVHSAYTLACHIHSTKDITIVNPDTQLMETHRMYYINDGVYGSFNSKLSVGEKFTPTTLCDNPGAVLMNGSIWGPTCDSVDCINENVLLPEMNIGDWIIYEEMGAYTVSIATAFNGFPVPKIFVILDENIRNLLKDKKQFENEFPLESDDKITQKSKSRYWTSTIIQPIAFSLINLFYLLQLL